MNRWWIAGACCLVMPLVASGQEPFAPWRNWKPADNWHLVVTVADKDKTPTKNGKIYVAVQELEKMALGGVCWRLAMVPEPDFKVDRFYVNLDEKSGVVRWLTLQNEKGMSGLPPNRKCLPELHQGPLGAYAVEMMPLGAAHTEGEPEPTTWLTWTTKAQDQDLLLEGKGQDDKGREILIRQTWGPGDRGTNGGGPANGTSTANSTGPRATWTIRRRPKSPTIPKSRFPMFTRSIPSSTTSACANL